ncbi:hypothetical protein L7F22_028213 [Adiantum nelumboides]|nr:hypothetical protein [Adiantum nelumboides]
MPWSTCMPKGTEKSKHQLQYATTRVHTFSCDALSDLRYLSASMAPLSHRDPLASLNPNSLSTDSTSTTSCGESAARDLYGGGSAVRPFDGDGDGEDDCSCIQRSSYGGSELSATYRSPDCRSCGRCFPHLKARSSTLSSSSDGDSSSCLLHVWGCSIGCGLSNSPSHNANLKALDSHIAKALEAFVVEYLSIKPMLLLEGPSSPRNTPQANSYAPSPPLHSLW